MDQVVPPSVVSRIVPYNPTTKPLLVSENLTLHNDSDVPLDKAIQVEPPFIDFKIVPESPTANPVFGSIK